MNNHIKILNILPKGSYGGIERLCLYTAKYSEEHNFYYFMWGGGDMADAISSITDNVICSAFTYRSIISEYHKLRNYVRDNGIEVILIQIPAPVFLLYAWLIKKSFSNIKVCIYIHADPSDVFSSTFKRIQFSLFRRYIDGCIVISEYVSKEMNKMFKGINTKRIYNGVDVSLFKKNNELSVGNATINIIYVGRLIYYKGVDILLDAIKKTNHFVRLNIVGDGPSRIELEKQAKDLELNDRVNFCGQHSNVEEWLQQADIFVHPASYQEGFGISLIEAMASGVPCIAFNRGAIPEIINDGENGFLVNDLSADSLARKMDEVISMFYNDKDAFKRVCENARNRAEDFDIHGYVNELNKYLKSL